MGGSPPWNKITSKKYEFSGKFAPYDVYHHVLTYLNHKSYDTDELEVEMKNSGGEISIFTHLHSELEFNRRYYTKLLFSIKMGGKVVDEKKGIVDGTLVIHVNGYFQVHSLLHEHHETWLSKFLTKFYDTYVNPSGAEEAIVFGVVVEIGKLMAEVKSKLQRR